MQDQLTRAKKGKSPSCAQESESTSVQALLIENEILRDRLKRQELSLLKVHTNAASLNDVKNDRSVRAMEVSRLKNEMASLRASLKEKEDLMARQTMEYNDMKAELERLKGVLHHSGTIKSQNMMSCSTIPTSGESPAFFSFVKALQ
eukprot:scaffold7429_cov166-Cylindrotheca_fusiformis.AAC.2